MSATAGDLAALVRAAERRARAGRMLEALALGLAATGVAWALAIRDGAAPGEWPALAAALVGGSFAGLAWALERWPRRGSAVRVLDRGWEPRGELATAWECERDDRGGALDALLVERVRARLDPRALLAGLPLPSPAWLALPLAAAALVALAAERRPDAAPPVSALAAELARARGAARGADRASGETGELGAWDRAAALVAALDATPAGPARAAVAERLEAAARELAEGAPPEARAALADLAAAVSAAGARSAPRGGPGAGADRVGESGATLAAGSAERTMSGRPPGAESRDGAPGEPPESGDRAPTGGETRPAGDPLPARWWPADYDRIVTPWILRHRAAPNR